MSTGDRAEHAESDVEAQPVAPATNYSEGKTVRKVRILVAVFVLVLIANPVAPGNASEASPTTLYFHSASPVGNVDHRSATLVGGAGTYMDQKAPTKSDPAVAVAVARGTYPSRAIYGPAWRAPAIGTITGDALVTFWATGAATGFDVHLFVDEDLDDDAYLPFASTRVTAVRSTSPVQYTASFAGLNAKVDREVFVQIAPVVQARDSAARAGDVNVYYDSADYPSRIKLTVTPPPSVPAPVAPFENYYAPESFIGTHGPNELSIGVNPKTNAAMLLMSLSTASVAWDDSVSPPRATWTDRSYAPTSMLTMDPYLFTDRATGRTFVLQLVGEASIAAYTDDDGATWTLMNPPSAAPSFDHESLAAGPYPAGHAFAGNPYGRAVYYCAQGIFLGQCTRSDDGGQTWNVPLDFSVLTECFPSHGRILVDDLGYLYVPVEDCGEKGQGVFISRDAGMTWEQRVVPGTKPGWSDPVVSVDSAGTLYYTAASGGTILVSTSTDRGRTFSQPVNVGALVGVKQAELPMAVAGDAGRVAVAFYGSKDAGDAQDPDYTGEWHLYVATTLDGGKTWSVIDVTPNDPVQRGMICLSGASCGSGRNLLDFQGITIDRDGRVLVAYADGCTSPECKAAKGKNVDDAGSHDSWAVIARQMSGQRLTGPLTP